MIRSLSRRQFLAGNAAMIALPHIAWAAPATILEARAASIQLVPDEYPATGMWTYDGVSPGPELRFKQGARLERRLANRLDQPTSIHWHGIRVPNAMDGVAGLTQDAVAPGEGFDYAFDLPDAGTYWYHAHANSPEQVGRGLYGALVVEEAERPDVDVDIVLMLDDWLLNSEAQIDPSFASMHDLSHGGRFGNFPTTNAQADFTREVRKNERLRLRLVNAANARIFPLALKGAEGWIVAHDGMPLEAPQRLKDEIILGPAQRADLIVDIIAEEGEEAVLVHLDDGNGFAQATFPVTGRASANRRAAPNALPANPVHSPVLDGARSVPMPLQGGAMGRMRAARYLGREMGARELVGEGQFWALAGQVGRGESPLVEAAMGETIRMPMANETAWPHAMHLHGMHFREVFADGSLGPMRDTLLVAAGETREIAFLADNPGDWLIHCHMLGHAATGMNQWLRVT